MAGESFELFITYPDGHVEVIEEVFYSIEKAKEYGVSMMNQIKATEAYHVKSGAFDKRSLKKAKYEIYKVVGHERELVETGK